MNHSFAHLLVFVLELLLFIYLVYTFVAIFKGAAPIPSRRSNVARMIRLANMRPGEVLIDLGSGDGRILFEAAKSGASCHGFEINPFLFAYSALVAKLKRLSNVTISRRDFWTEDLANVDCVTAYLVPKFMQKLEAKVMREMKPGSRIVLSTYPFPTLQPDSTEENVYLYVV